MSAPDAWTITNRRHDAHALSWHNSVFTVSNGYLGLKGNLQEQRDGPCPVTLINGVYDEIDQFGTLRASNRERRYLDPRHFDSAGRSPAVANLPNPLLVRVFVGEREISLGRGTVSGFVQTLDLRTGLYRYAFDYRDAAGRTTRIEMQRFAALRHPHRVFMRYAVTPLDHSAPLRILSGIDGNVWSNTTRERQPITRAAHADPPERCRLHAFLPARKHDVRVGVQNIWRGPAACPAPRGVIEHDAVYTCYEPATGALSAGLHPGGTEAPGDGPAGPASHSAEPPAPSRPDLPQVAQPCAAGPTVTIDRCIVLTCSEDARHGIAVALEDELSAAAAQGFDAALEEQRAAWAALWERADVQIDGDERAQLYLRFCVYHLLAAAPWHTDRLSVPVKLLSGEYYQGNTFWDTDLYIVPFYTFTFPELARTCLNFRYHGLTCARALARRYGYQGAKFAWQAGPYGEECLGPWYRFVHTNIHINADVAYALMHYWQATGDEEFMRERGIDILVETARFYHSRAALDPERGGQTFEDVAGPDEGHCESTSNFYTNYLARRNLCWAADMLDRLRRQDFEEFQRSARRLRLQPDEPARWRETAAQLILLFDPATRLYEQYDGFFRLQPAPADLLEGRQEWFATVFPYQALNQPDVVMALMLFRDDFAPEVRRANWEFYKDKSMNFSSMSFAINALAALDAGSRDEAYRNFLISAGMDLDEELTGRRDTHAGLHGTAMGGAWLAAVCGFGGVRLAERGLHIDPALPRHWRRLRFNLVLRGVVIGVAIDGREVTLSAGSEHAVELPLIVAGREVVLSSGQCVRTACPGDQPA